MNLKKTALVVAAFAAFAVPVAASAQPAPGYASQDEQIRGTIASIGDKYTVYVRDQRGYVDTVRLHDGTIINPTGLTLAPGQSVTVSGRTSGHAFDANEIDTPYNIDDGYADAGYAPVDVGPYPYYDSYPAYVLPYATYLSFGFGFGGGYYGRGYYGGGYYGRGYYGGGYYGHGYYGHGYAYGNGYDNGRRFAQGAGGYSYGHSSSYGRGSYGGGVRSSGSRATTSFHGGGGGSFHGGGGSHH